MNSYHMDFDLPFLDKVVAEQLQVSAQDLVQFGFSLAINGHKLECACHTHSADTPLVANWFPLLSSWFWLPPTVPLMASD